MKTKAFNFNIDLELSKIKRKKIIDEVDDTLARIIREDIPFFKKIKRFVIFSGGKRIRPLTHYYFSRLLNYSGKEWKDVAAIGELIHAASLLHDDVIDNAAERRGKPTVNHLHGNKRAILGGDYLLACGIDHLITLSRKDRLLPVFTRVIRNLAVAEVLQMENEKNFAISMEVYENIILGKTADLFSAMVEGAAILAEKDDDSVREYRDFGLRMGRLFQIRDDYLDYFAKEDQGKKLYGDYERGLITYPVLILRKQMSKQEVEELRDIWQDDAQRKVYIKPFLKIMEKYSVATIIQEEIEKEIENLINFIRNHNTNNKEEQAEMIDTLARLSVS